MKKEFDYILFDLDGTILNTRDGIVECIQEALATQGILIDDLNLLERHIGPPLKSGFLEYYEFDEETADQVVNEFRKHYKVKGIPGTKPYPGITECLSALKQAGYHLIVATSKPEFMAKKFLSHFGLDTYFEDICGSVEEGKEVRLSKAEVIDYVLRHNNMIKRDCVVMVGDRFHDVEGAAKFNIPCIGVSYGFGSKEELLAAGAIDVVADCDELTRYFLR